MKDLVHKLEAYKLPLLIFLLGLLLMLLPGGNKSTKTAPEATLREALSMTQGVGEAYVLLSDQGVVVVCDGAASAEVRMAILEAVRAYTGFGADKISILKRSTQ